VTQEDLIEMDFNAKIVGGNPNFTPFSESVIHCSIYKARKDVNCVCHPHPGEVIPFTCTDVPLSGIYHQYTFYDGIPVFSDLPPECGLLINSIELGDNLAAALGDKRGVLIRNHGVVVVRESLPRTVFSTITLRDNAKMLISTLSLGVQIKSYSGVEEIKKSTYGHFCGQPAKRAWDYWCMRAKQSFPDIADLNVDV
jgi:ribulose-5-phosphate 4-epimerase/fuculose-1-phosphate aldolase